MIKYIMATLILLMILSNQAQGDSRHDHGDIIINNYYGQPATSEISTTTNETINNYGLSSDALAAGMIAGDQINFDPNSRRTQIGGGVGFDNSYIGFAAAIGRRIDNTFYRASLIKFEGEKEPTIGAGFVRNF